MTKEMGSNVVWFGLGAAFLLAALVRIFIFDLFLVEGSSMEPAFKDGSVILLNRAAYGLELPFSEGYLARWGKPAAGDVLVYRDPLDGSPRVKRCSRAETGERVYLLGDNEGVSLDSRFIGSVSVEKVLGKVILAIER